MFASIKTLNIAGVQTAIVNRIDLANTIGQYAVANKNSSKSTKLVFSANAHSISEANTDAAYKAILNDADLVHADGQSIIKFSHWLYGKQAGIPERTATTDMIHDLPNYFDKPLSHFLLGANEETVVNAGNILTHKHSRFELAGTQNGYFSVEQEDEIIDKINASNADILWVGLGKPKEQQFCVRNKSRIRVPVTISCGGCYNFITGEYKRAPEWMQSSGFEWLHRVALRPKHLFWRYAITNPHAIFSVLKQKWVLR